MTTPSRPLICTRRVVSRYWKDDHAVSEVVGQVLLVGITITTMVGLTILVMNIDGPLDKTHADIEYGILAGADGWNSGDEVVRMQHVGGEAIDRDSAVLRILVNGVATEISGAALDGAWSDGSLSVTEAWDFSTTLDFGDEVEVLVIDRVETTLTSSTTLTAGSSAIGGDPVLTYVTSGTGIVGTVVGPIDVSAAQDPADSGAETGLQEVAVTETTQERNGAVTDFTSVTGGGIPVIASDNVRARFNSMNDEVVVGGFSNIAGAASVIQVEVLLEGKRPTGTDGDPTIQLSYLVDGVDGGAQADRVITSTSDQLYTAWDITGFRAWTPDDIEKLEVVAKRLSPNTNFAHADIDALTIRVTYGLAGSSLEVDFNFDNVPGGISQQLELEYRVSGDDFRVEIWNGVTWVKKGILLTKSTSTVWTATLNNDEYNGGMVRIKFLDETPSGGSAGQLLIDYARVRTI